jgi:hypothetical protein
MVNRGKVIFLSYASEDRPLAEQVVRFLEEAFRRGQVQVVHMPHRRGVNWRNRCDKFLDAADILLIVADGRERLSHSFTGYDLGFFRKSQQDRKYIDEKTGVERLITAFVRCSEPATAGSTEALLYELATLGISDEDSFLYELATTQTAFVELLERIERTLFGGELYFDPEHWRLAARRLHEGLIELTSSPGAVAPVRQGRKIFIVHGHDQWPREAVTSFLESMGFEPIILHEQPNRGRSIITKFREEAADVVFAIVLMTPDDFGGATGADSQPRARQNVVFELGFFIGAFGPERVAPLVKGDIERPSDFEGVGYISLDDADWQKQLERELTAAGLLLHDASNRAPTIKGDAV